MDPDEPFSGVGVDCDWLRVLELSTVSVLLMLSQQEKACEQ